MKALSIRQPWAWLIIHGGKDIENRTWRTKFRGPVLIHASKGLTTAEYVDAEAFAFYKCNIDSMPNMNDLERGGIVGMVDIVDCVSDSTSPWYMGSFGFVLRNAKPLPFTPMRGMLGFFDAPADYILPLAAA